jgi:hypothetical protein
MSFVGQFKVDQNGSGGDQTPFQVSGIPKLFVAAHNVDTGHTAGSTLLTLP